MRLNCKPSQLHVHIENHMICSFNVNMLITGCIIFLDISKYLYTITNYLLYRDVNLGTPNFSVLNITLNLYYQLDDMQSPKYIKNIKLVSTIF